MSKRSRFARYNQKNPTTTDYVLAGAGVLVAAGVSYWIYAQSQENALAGSAGYENAPGTFTNTGSGGVGPAAGGSGTQVFDPNNPATPGPVGPTTGPTPVPPFPVPPV